MYELRTITIHPDDVNNSVVFMCKPLKCFNSFSLPHVKWNNDLNYQYVRKQISWNTNTYIVCDHNIDHKLVFFAMLHQI